MSRPLPPPKLLATIVPDRGHACLYARRGERCPGPAGCTTLAEPWSGRATDGNGVHDGFRCLGCGQWARKAEDILHTARCFETVPTPPPRWNPLLGRRVPRY